MSKLGRAACFVFGASALFVFWKFLSAARLEQAPWIFLLYATSFGILPAALLTVEAFRSPRIVLDNDGIRYRGMWRRFLIPWPETQHFELWLVPGAPASLVVHVRPAATKSGLGRRVLVLLGLDARSVLATCPRGALVAHGRS